MVPTKYQLLKCDDLFLSITAAFTQEPVWDDTEAIFPAERREKYVCSMCVVHTAETFAIYIRKHFSFE